MQLTITKELCDKYKFADGHDCPLFHAAAAAGLNVTRAGCSVVTLLNGKILQIRPRFYGTDYRAVQETGVPFVCEVKP